MNNLFSFFFILFIFISCAENKREIKENTRPLYSVLILNNFSPERETEVLEKHIYALNKPNFVEIIDYKNSLANYKNNLSGKVDTIRIKHTNNIMLVNLNFSALIQNTYYLKRGDTIVVDYTNLEDIKEYYKNSNTLVGDIQKTNIKDSILFIPDFMIENVALKIKAIKKDSLNYILAAERLDSLYRNNLIFEPFYKIIKIKFLYSQKIKSNDFDDNIFLKNDSIIGLEEYQSYIVNHAFKKFNITNIKSNNGSFPNYKTAFDSVYQSDIYGEKAKDYLLFYYLDRMTENFSYNDFKERFEKFKQTAKDTTLVAFLEDKYLLNFTDLKEETQEIYFINSQKQKQTLSQILEENKNKVIYVDFWASWCAPCRTLMPVSRELHKQYKDKDVVFLYLSIDNDFEKWQKANRDEGLSQNRFSLLAVNYPNANFYKELNLRTIPRYLLYDKQGNLVHKNAPSPDSDIIKQELDKLLKN